MLAKQKKVLAEQLKAKLNSPDYIAMPDLITYDDRCCNMLAWLHGSSIDGNIYKENNWISCEDINPSKHMVKYNELEKDDWGEIVNLIKKRNQEKEQIWETKKKNIEQKLNQQPSNLYYYWNKARSKNERADCLSVKKGMRGFATFLGGNGNGLTHHLYIAKEHPVLDNFPFQAGFYLIENKQSFKKAIGHYEGGFESSGGETNPYNWKKYVETDDQITITPYELLEKPIDYPKENKGFSPLKEKPTNKADKKVVDWLIQYFQENNIKEIALKNNELVITNNNNEVVASSKRQENQIIKHYLQESNKQSLNRQELSGFLDTESIPTNPKNNMPLLIGGGIVVLVVGIVIGFLVKNRVKKSK